MGIFEATSSQIVILFLLIFSGYMLAKIKAVPEQTATVLSKLENNLLVPALVLGSFSKNFTVEKLQSAWKLFLISAGIAIFMIVLAMFVSKLCTKDTEMRKIYAYGLAFSNFGYMGNAVVNGVFPNLFFDYLIFTMPLFVLVYSWGIPTLLIPTGAQQHTWKSLLKNLANPMFVALLIGGVIGLTGFKMPNVLMNFIDTTGGCMSPVAMILTGVVVAKMDIKKVFTTISIYVVSLIRLVIFPLLFVIMFRFVTVPETIRVCTICSLAMPLGLSTIIIPCGYGKDPSIAVGMTVISSIASLVTMPLIFYLMMNI